MDFIGVDLDKNYIRFENSKEFITTLGHGKIAFAFSPKDNTISIFLQIKGQFVVYTIDNSSNAQYNNVLIDGQEIREVFQKFHETIGIYLLDYHGTFEVHSIHSRESYEIKILIHEICELFRLHTCVDGRGNLQ